MTYSSYFKTKMGACALAATVLSGVVHCSSLGDATSAEAGPHGDGGVSSEDSSTGPDSAAADAALPAPPNALVVHASALLGDVRLCFATTTSPDAGSAAETVATATPWPDDPSNPMPASNLVGVTYGWGLPARQLTALGAAWLVVYAISERVIRTDTNTCDKLVCSSGTSCLPSGVVYRFPPVAATGLGSGVHVLALTGCPSGSGGDAARCGADFDNGTGNLRALLLQLDPSAARPRDDGTRVGVQVAQLAPEFASASVTWTIGDAAVANHVAFGHVAPSTLAELPLPSTDGEYGARGAQITFYGGDGGAGAPAATSMLVPLSTIQRSSAPQSLPEPFFGQPSSFVFALVGDTTEQQLYVDGGAPNPEFKGKGLHVLALPTAAAPADAGAD